MKKIVIALIGACAFTFTANAANCLDEPQKETCVKSEWQTPIIVYGNSKETCVKNNSDGSKTVTQKDCTTRGVNASVKGVGYKSVSTQCETTTKTVPANSSSNNDNKNNK